MGVTKRPHDRGTGLLRLDWSTGSNVFATIGFAPFSVDVGYVRSQSADRNFQKTLPFRCLKQDPFFFGEAMPDGPAANAGFGWKTSAEAFNIIFSHLGHAPNVPGPGG